MVKPNTKNNVQTTTKKIQTGKKSKVKANTSSIGELQPVSINGIEFDALIEATDGYSATIPAYPVEEGFPTSDTIVLDPQTFSATLYLSPTPVTWLSRHGTGQERVYQICEQLEQLWLSKELVKITTTSKVYTSMGITALSIRKSTETRYSREITIEAQKVRTTTKQISQFPAEQGLSGDTGSNAGSVKTTDKGGAKGKATASKSSSNSRNSDKIKAVTHNTDNSAWAQDYNSPLAVAERLAKVTMGTDTLAAEIKRDERHSIMKMAKEIEEAEKARRTVKTTEGATTPSKTTTSASKTSSEGTVLGSKITLDGDSSGGRNDVLKFEKWSK